MVEGEEINNQLRDAAKDGNVAEMQSLIAKGADVKATDLWGTTVMHLAARGGSVAAMELLLSKGAQPTAISKTGYSSLFCAAYYGHVDAMEFLIANGADVRAPTHDDGRTPLHSATLGAHIAMTIKAPLQGLQPKMGTPLGMLRVALARRRNFCSRRVQIYRLLIKTETPHYILQPKETSSLRPY